MDKIKELVEETKRRVDDVRRKLESNKDKKENMLPRIYEDLELTLKKIKIDQDDILTEINNK